MVSFMFCFIFSIQGKRFDKCKRKTWSSDQRTGRNCLKTTEKDIWIGKVALMMRHPCLSQGKVSSSPVEEWDRESAPCPFFGTSMLRCLLLQSLRNLKKFCYSVFKLRLHWIVCVCSYNLCSGFGTPVFFESRFDSKIGNATACLKQSRVQT